MKREPFLVCLIVRNYALWPCHGNKEPCQPLKSKIAAYFKGEEKYHEA
jgi:hypothetical protein